MFLVAGLAVGAGWVWFNSEVERRAQLPLRLENPSVLDIASGASLDDVLSQLEDRKLTDDRWWIRRYAIAAGYDKQLKVGEFRLLPGDSARTLLARIVAGDVIRYRFTIVEGWTLAQALQALTAAPLRHTEGVHAQNVHELLKVDPLPGRPATVGPRMEGWLLPATYDHTRSDSDLDVLRRAFQAMQNELDRLWDTRATDLPYADSYAALTMASIIEKESSIGADRPLIASVFVRRLRLGMRLQTDPTVIYGIGAGFDGNLTRNHLTTPTPYNTYTNAGLPPTPIALPGGESLRAAFNPADSEYLYFVGRGDGSSVFSRTLAEHNKAVNTYQRSPRKRQAP